jgi:GNAT superfamily N-acetyltransferase
MPLLFLKDAVPVGTVRLDVEEGAGAGTIRLVAILPAYQRQGLGRAMIGGVEGLAVDMGVTKLRVHAAPDAIGFYEKLGWGLAGSATPRPLLVKRLKAG